jgi:hypothetical protein
MNRLIAIACTVVTVFGVWLGTKAMASFYPPAGGATDCAPDSITPMVTANGFHSLQKFGPFNGWAYAFNIQAKFQWTCPVSDVSYAYTCAPCYQVKLYRDVNYSGNINEEPSWVDQQREDFNFSGQPSGACGTGGVYQWNMTCNQLTAGRYLIEIELGAGDARRCYILRRSWQQIILP